MDNEGVLLPSPQPVHPSSAVLNNYHLIVCGTGFQDPNAKCKKGVPGQVLANQLRLRGAEFDGVKEELDRVHFETQHTQEFAVGLIKPMKIRALKQQA